LTGTFVNKSVNNARFPCQDLFIISLLKTTKILAPNHSEPLFENGLTSYFSCTQCDTEELQNWRISVTAPKPELVEIVTFIPN